MSERAANTKGATKLVLQCHETAASLERIANQYQREGEIVTVTEAQVLRRAGNVLAATIEALERLDALVDFEAPWGACDCFGDTAASNLDRAKQKASAALAKARGEEESGQ